MRSKTQITIISILLSWVIIFGSIPLLLLLATSFFQQHPEKFFQFSFSIQSYFDLLNPVYFDVLLRSFKFATLTTLICLAVGYPFAWCTCRVQTRYRIILLVMLMIPFWTNSLIRTYAIRLVLGTQGLLNKLLQFIGLTDSPIRFMYTEFAVVLGLVYLMLPFMILPLYSNMEKLNYSLIEASRDLGANGFQTFRKIIWPLTQSGVIAGCIMVFVPTMGMFYVATLLGGAKQLLVGNLIQQQFLVSHNWPMGSAMSIVLIVIMALMLGIYALIFRGFSSRRLPI